MDKPTIHHHGLDFLRKKTKLEPLGKHHVSGFGAVGVHHEGIEDSRTYWWLWASDNGRHIVWGPYITQEEGYRRGYAKLHCPFEVVPLHTRDTNAASATLRSRLLDETGNIGESFKRFKHKEE